MFPVLILITGGIMSVMIAANGALADYTGGIPALIIIHSTGLVLVSLIIPFIKQKKEKRSVNPGLYTAGFIGVLLTLAGIYTVQTIGVSLTFALQLTGQLIGAFIIDALGMPGIPRKAFSITRIMALLAALAGCGLMIDFSDMQILPVLVACLSGFMSIASFSINASLGSCIGVFRAVRINYITGLVGSLALLTTVSPHFSKIPGMLTFIPWYILVGGGVCGVITVTGMAVSLPHVSVLYSTQLVFIGQQIIGYIFDSMAGKTTSGHTVAGGILIAAGLSFELIRQLLLVHKKR